MATRDSIRSQVFAKKDLKSKTLDFFGTQIELRQPKLKDILDAQQEAAQQAEDGVSSAVVSILLQYAYVPGTSEKVFEAGDRDALLQLPFDENLIGITEALEELTKVNFTKPSADSQNDQTST